VDGHLAGLAAVGGGLLALGGLHASPGAAVALQAFLRQDELSLPAPLQCYNPFLAAESCLCPTSGPLDPSNHMPYTV
jgi:hypothetical protein